MNDTKPLYKSRTFWGVVASLMCSILALVGHEVDAGLEAEMVECGVAIGGVIGALIALYGRIKADTKIGGLRQPSSGQSAPHEKTPSSRDAGLGAETSGRQSRQPAQHPASFPQAYPAEKNECGEPCSPRIIKSQRLVFEADISKFPAVSQTDAPKHAAPRTAAPNKTAPPAGADKGASPKGETTAQKRATRPPHIALFLVLAIPVLLTACALKHLSPQEKALAIGEEMRTTYIALYEEYGRLHQAFSPEDTRYLEHYVAPVMDETKRAIVAYRNAAEAFARLKAKPENHDHLLGEARHLIANCAATLCDARRLFPHIHHNPQPEGAK